MNSSGNFSGAGKGLVKRLFITMGDPQGIGAEIILKSLKELLCSPQNNNFIPIIIGDETILTEYAERYSVALLPLEEIAKKGRVYFIAVESEKNPGADSLNYIKKSVGFLLKHPGSALITAPVSKRDIAVYEKNFRGHTEYIASLVDSDNVAMTFISSKVKISLLTTHIPLKEVSSKITKETIISHIDVVLWGLKMWFKMDSPRMVVCSLNPHAGEGGLVGDEEKNIFIPAVKELKKRGVDITCPVVAASALEEAIDGKYDFIVTCYHDQILPAVKALLGPSVNLTMGLPFIRTSPDHGTARDIAGKDIADYRSMKEAIKLAASPR